MSPAEKSWVYCGHANECPHICPCGPDCICRDGMCKPKYREFSEWGSFQQAIQAHIDQHGREHAAFEPMARMDATIVCKVCGEQLVFRFVHVISRMMAPPNRTEVAEHHRHRSFLDLIESARRHVEHRSGHRVRSMDDPQNKQFGFLCEDCGTTFLISVDDYRGWLRDECSEEARRLIGILMFRRHFLFALMNSAGDFLDGLSPMTPIETNEPTLTAHQRIMADEDS